jgi:tRNA modification GTPase
MFSTDDTIVAIATPLGRSGIGLVRLSGPRAAQIAALLIGRTRPLTPRRATFARLATSVPNRPPSPGDLRPSTTSVPDRPQSPVVSDQVIATFFAGPQSYTGEDVAEISAHGSPVVLQDILRRAIAAGARLAEPGEFTLRAFLNGKLDLIQAEAVADLIDAVTPLQARAAFDQLEGTLTLTIRAIESDLFDLMARLEASLDFPDEGYHFITAHSVVEEIATITRRIDDLLAQASRGRLIREGAQLAIIGTPNVGKSSLFNTMLNANRAIVTAIPGTTRDLLTERADVRGLSLALVDTAGIRTSTDVIEQEGVIRAKAAAKVADLTLLIVDRSRPLSVDDQRLLNERGSSRRVVVINKVDLPPAWFSDSIAVHHPVEVSVKTGQGLEALMDSIEAQLASTPDSRDAPAVTNVRHITLLDHARGALARAGEALGAGSPSEEFILADLQDAAAHLQEITGHRTTDDLLRHIFERFCIGK